MSTSGRSSAASPGEPSAMSPAPARRACGSSAPSPPSRRSSPRRRTARSLTPSRASVRSARANWSSSTWGRCSTATARTAPAPSPPARLGDEAREVYELVQRAQAAALEAVRPGASGKEVDAVAREIDLRGRPRRPLRAWARPRRGPRGPRGTSARDHLRGRAAGGQRRHGRARRLPARPPRRPDRGPVVVTGDGYRNLSGLAKDLRIV